MKSKQLRGYIFARNIAGSSVPHKVQNLVIREFCKNNNYLYLLSSVEYKMKNSYLILNDILKELPNLDGIVMYSMFQSPENDYQREKIFTSILKKSKLICFALENIIIENKNDFKDFDTTFRLNKLLKYCPQKV